MNSNVRAVLFDLIEYYNAMGTENDPGIGMLESVVQRSSHELAVHGRKTRENTKNSSNVDPFETPQS